MLFRSGVVEHDFTITGVTGRAYALPASKGTGTFDLTKPGTYAVMCSIPGHKEAGMVATLVVGEEGGTRSVAATGSAPAAAAVPTMIAAKPGLAPLPAPQIALPIGAREATTVKVDLETREVSALLADGITYTYESTIRHRPRPHDPGATGRHRGTDPAEFRTKPRDP